MSELLPNYLAGRWQAGSGGGTPLFDPVLGHELVRVDAGGLDLAAGFAHAREQGGAALRALNYKERGALLAATVKVLQANRDAYYDIATANSGTVKNDSAVDIDGAIFTLGHYAKLGETLGERRFLLDGEPARLGKDPLFQAQHLLVPTRGVALFINAFNFPSWGLWEKAAPALLSGVPVIVKPATATAWLTQRMVRDVVEAGVLPVGALSVVCGSSAGLMDALQPFDVVSFTGSAETAAVIRSHPAVAQRSVRVNIEADSLNSALLLPGAQAGGDTFNLLVREVVREMSVKSGQKCTAIRRIFVPEALYEAAGQAIAAKLEGISVGNPRNETVRMGALVSRAQLQSVREGLAALQGQTTVLRDGSAQPLVDADPAVAACIGATLLGTREPDVADRVHDTEVFGPVATLLPYRSLGHALALVRRGQGSLVASLYGDDPAAIASAAIELADSHGRVHAVSPDVATLHTGHGNVMPHVAARRPGPCRRRRRTRRTARAELLPPPRGAAGQPGGFGRALKISPPDGDKNMPPTTVAPPGARYNFARQLLDGNAGRAAKIAYIDDHGTLTYGELAERTRRMAAALLQAGLRREERVLLLMHDCNDWPVSFLGALYAGVVPVAVNTLLTADDYAYMLRHSRAQAALVSAALLPMLSAGMAQGPHEVRTVFVSRPEGALPAGHHAIDDMLQAQSPLAQAADTGPDDPGFWLYSSGSTGKPKGTVHTHGNPYWTTELYGKGVLGLTEHDVCFSAAKLYFAYGLGNALTFPLAVGASVVLSAERPTPDAVFARWTGRALPAAAAGRKPTVFFGAPTGFAGMLASPALPQRKEVALRMCSSAGEALPAEIGQKFSSHFGCEIIDGIGSTEMLHVFLSNRPGDVRYGTTGKPVNGYAVELRGEDGRPVADGEVGDLYIQGPSAALLYWGNRDKTRDTFQGAWTKSGDKYSRDADGYYTYAGRSDDMLKVSGIYVSPFEVEATLMQHPAVLECAVIGKSDADGLVKTKAFVVLKPGQQTDEAALKAFVKERLAPYKYPRFIEFVPELPKTATGKIQRFRLREREQAA